MSTEKTQDDKLRDAAEKVLQKLPGRIRGHYTAAKVEATPQLNDIVINNPIYVYSEEIIFGELVRFAKSKEAAKYHQSLQPVDVEALRVNFVDFYKDKSTIAFEQKGVLKPEVIFNWFLTHLQQAAPENDAVEFAKLMVTSMDGFMGGQFRLRNGKQGTMADHYAEYKQPKTNSDGNNS